LTFCCAGLFDSWGSRLELLKFTFNGENFICRFSHSTPTILAQFTLETCVAGRNHEKFTKNPNFGGSRSSMLTFLRSSLPVLVIVSSLSVLICNRFMLEQPIAEKRFFQEGAPLSAFHSRKCPSSSSMKFCHKILKTLSHHTAKNKSLYLTLA